MERLLAIAVCRVYGTLPFLVTPLLAAGAAASQVGALVAAAWVLAASAAALVLVPDLRARAAGVVVTTLVFAAVVLGPGLLVRALLPGASLPLALALGGGGGTLLALLAAWAPSLLPAAARDRVLAALLPDLLTGLLLLLLFGPWVALHRRLARRGPISRPAPPWRVRVVVTSWNEAATVERSLGELLREADRLRRLPEVASVEVVLADSGSSDGTRERAAALGVPVWDVPRGKLSARHAAYLREGADLIVAADADRGYPEGTLAALLAPLLSDPAVVAVTGETGSPRAPVGGSALVRSRLHVPFNGGNAAFLRAAYLAAPHDLEVNQFRHRHLWAEEEFRFGLALRSLGGVVHARGCSSFELRPYGLLRELLRHLFGVRLRTF